MNVQTEFPCFAVHSTLGQCVPLHQDGISAISHCLRGYGITAVICRRALFLSGDPCYFIWESSSEKSPAFPEISASQNWHCQSVPDDFAIRFLLHWTGTYHCSEKLHLWRDRCFVFDFVCLSDFSAGKADFLETCRLYSGFFRNFSH